MDINRFATVKSPLGATVGLVRMHGREMLGQPFQYDLELASEDPNIDFSKILGQPLTVELELADLSKRFFHGYVTQFRLVGGLGRYSRYRAVLRPWFWLLSKTVNSRVFNETQTVPDLVMQLFRDRGFTDFENRLSAHGYRQWEYRVQYRESEFQFVSRLLEQEGIYYYFKHFDNRHVLVLADDFGSHQVTPGSETVPYFPPTDHRLREVDHFESWNMVQQIEPGGYIIDDFKFEIPKPGNLRVPLRYPDSYAFGDYAVYDYPGEFDDYADGERYARVRLEQRKAEHELFEAAGNTRMLNAGALFTLKGYPRADQNRQYLVVSNWCEIVNNAYESSGAVDGVGYRCGITAIDAKRPFRVQEITPKPKVDGPQTAIVVGEKDAEITTDKYGRVRVQFHWDRVGKWNEKSSCWVRVAQLWAGSGFGGMHIPRVGQEVVVDFLEGNPDRPIIIGRVYNNDNMPPYTLPANKTQSGIKSRSTKGGDPQNFNELRFEDLKGQEEFHMQAEKNMTTLVKNDRSATIMANDSIGVSGDRSVHVTGNLAITVDGKGKSPNHSSHSVTGKYNLHASDTIDGDAPTHIKFVCGGTSITMDPHSITLQAGDGAKIVLDAKAFTQANAKGNILVDANVLATSAAGHSALVDGGSVKLTAGPSTVTTTPSSVAVNSQTVTANGGPSGLELASAGATMTGPKATLSGAGSTEITGAVVKIN